MFLPSPRTAELTVAIVEAPKLAAFAAAAASVKENVFAVVYLGAKNDAAISKIEAEGLKVYSWEEIQSLGAAHPRSPPHPRPTTPPASCTRLEQRARPRGSSCRMPTWWRRWWGHI